MNTERSKQIVLVVLLAVLALLVYPQVAVADEVTIGQAQLGSGTPGVAGASRSTPVMDGMYHTPGYLPGYPTAATIFPRVVDVDCKQISKVVTCNSFNWMPEMGRGEYLFIRPRIAAVPVVAPVVVEKIVEVPVIVYKEVPTKTGKE